MSSANRVDLTWVRESTPGTTPNTPRMRRMRFTGIPDLGLFLPEYQDGDEMADDRMTNDPTKVFQASSLNLSVNLSFFPNLSPESDLMASAFYNDWTLSPERDNDGTADSVITAVATANEVLTVTTGAAFVAGHLAKFSGFGVAGNNGVFKCTQGSATVPRFVGAGLTDEAAPPAAARVKVVGFQGASDDITATAAGLASTLLDFTTLGILPGMTLDIGGSAAGDKFATAALNVSVTVESVAANLITLANKPAGWTTDAGAGKTIKVWFGDMIKNGVKTDATRISGTVQAGFMGQTVPSYMRGKGMTVNTLAINFKHKDKVRLGFSLMGQGGDESTTSLDASPDARSTTANISANVNFARLMEGGVQMGTPNYPRSLDVTLNNNLRQIEDLTIDSPAGINEGENEANVRFETYYGSDGLIQKFYNGTPTSIFVALTKNSQAVSLFLPRQTYRGGGKPTVTGKNTDVMLPLEGKASRDTTTSSHVIMNRLEYVE